MTAEACRQWRELLGAFVLGGLDGDERSALEAHLEGCAECRAERELLTPVAEILPLADPEWLGEAPSPPGSLGRRIVRRVESERRARRRKHVRTGFTLAGAGALAATVLAIVLVGGSSPAPAGAQVAFDGLPNGVRINAHIEPRPWGSEVDVYVHGMQRGTRCVVFLRGAHHERVGAGSFRYSYRGEAGSGLSADMRLGEARAIGIRAGHRVFVAPIPEGSA